MKVKELREILIGVPDDRWVFVSTSDGLADPTVADLRIDPDDGEEVFVIG